MMATQGRPAEIDLTELERLSAMQCTDEEIAAWFSVSTRTIERKRKEPEFAEIMERGKAKGRISLRRQQLKLLEAGNSTMAVWLGKQYLGQTDEIRHELAGPTMILMVSPELTRLPENEDCHVIDVPARGY
jgi:hypothetical protein